MLWEYLWIFTFNLSAPEQAGRIEEGSGCLEILVYTWQLLIPPDQVTECLGSGLNVTLGMSVSMFGDGSNVWINHLSKADCLPQCWSTELERTWKKRLCSLCLIFFNMRHRSSPVFGLRLELALCPSCFWGLQTYIWTQFCWDWSLSAVHTGASQSL